MSKHLYFAYGSNLDDAQMATRCPGARALHVASLAGHRLVFGGFSQRWGGAVANVEPHLGGHVMGLVYELTAADLVSLDGFEGHPHKYERRPVSVRVPPPGALAVAQDERDWMVSAYFMQPSFFTPGRPPDGYFGAIFAAYQRLGFDAEPLLEAGARRLLEKDVVPR